jgi:HK97 family phage prohead protease
MTIEVRTFPFQFELRDVSDDGDGRTVFGRIVPYGEEVPFVDEYDGKIVKKERFQRGALTPQTNNAAFARVLLSFQHDNGFANTIGYGRALEERDDGAYAAFRLYAADAPKAREMILTSHRGMSLEFEPRDDGRDGTVIVRKRVHLRRVGVTPDPAYKGAEVLAVRESSAVATPNLDAVRARLNALQATAMDRLRRASDGGYRS